MEISRIEDLLQKVYKGSAWHGPNIKSVLDEVNAATALYRVKDSHNIAELVGHMAAWRSFVVEKLNGNDEFDLSEEENFVVINEISPKKWKKLREAYYQSQLSLSEALKKQADELLAAPVGKRRR